MTFSIYSDSKSEYRWRLRATNGQIIAVSGEGYVHKADCQHAIQLVKAHAPSASINDETAARSAYGR
jgi:uncharacterized protein YegP (UPF0339 family)